MSVVLTVVSLGVRVILSYILSSISIIGVIGIWMVYTDWMAFSRYIRRRMLFL